MVADSCSLSRYFSAHNKNLFASNIGQQLKNARQLIIFEPCNFRTITVFSKLYGRHGSGRCGSFYYTSLHNIFHISYSSDHYCIHDTIIVQCVENKETILVFMHCKKYRHFSRLISFWGLFLLRHFALHKSSKNCDTRFFKYCFFKNLGL
jgi:hypothetical protein